MRAVTSLNVVWLPFISVHVFSGGNIERKLTGVRAPLSTHSVALFDLIPDRSFV